MMLLAVKEDCGLSRWWGMGEDERIQSWHVMFGMPVRYSSRDVGRHLRLQFEKKV